MTGPGNPDGRGPGSTAAVPPPGSPIGLSTYAFFWQWSEVAEKPLKLGSMIYETADQGGTVFQICDYPQLTEFDKHQLESLGRFADDHGITLELGTRGVRPEHLLQFLDIAQRMGVRLVRSMMFTADDRPAPTEAVQLLRQSMPSFEAAGVTVALETYEQLPTATLVATVREVNSPALGICLDPANCVAALELPTAVIDQTADLVRNIHVKDFEFTRQPGWVGFSLVGAPLGTGLLDYDYLINTVRPADRGISRIIEHWLPWQGDAATTIAAEQRWTAINLDYLRSHQS